MRPVVAIHGISPKADATDFSHELRRGVTTLARRHGLEAPQWREVVWSDLSDIRGESALAQLADLVQDVERYDHDLTARAAIQGRLRRALGAHSDAVLVAHSLGSAIACDVLCQPNPPDVGALITMGSPLGIVSELASYRWRVEIAQVLEDLDWLDIWSPYDPIHTGLGWVRGARGLDSVGYPCRSRELELVPTVAHTGYWAHPRVAAWVLEAAGAS